MSSRSESEVTASRVVPRLVVAGAAVGLYGVAESLARRQEVGPAEQAAFRAVNELPGWLHAPIWAVMQLGSLAGPWVVGGVLALSGRRREGVVTGLVGTAVWGGAKLAKRRVGRGRPAAHLDGVRVRGTAQTGLGFPSGHAAVSAAVVLAVAPLVPPAVGTALAAAAGVTSAARVFVGAHLPLDVAGGVLLGVAAGAVGGIALGPWPSRADIAP